MIKPLRKAVLPVAGLGTRFLPATKAMAKEMLPVVDKPLIQYAVEEARAAGIEQFCMVTGRGKTALVEHFDIAYELEATLRERGKTEALATLRDTQLPARARSSTVRQQVPLGLGHAIWCARAFIGDDPFAILLPDDLVLADTPCTEATRRRLSRDRRQRRRGHRSAARAHQPLRHPADIGKDDGRLVEVRGLVEKPEPEDAPSNLSIIGRYVLMPEVIGYLARMERGAGNEVQLTDGWRKLIGAAAVPRAALRGPPLRLRRQDRLPGSADRVRAEAAGSGRRGARLPEELRRDRVIRPMSHVLLPSLRSDRRCANTTSAASSGAPCTSADAFAIGRVFGIDRGARAAASAVGGRL